MGSEAVPMRNSSARTGAAVTAITEATANNVRYIFMIRFPPLKG